MKKLDLKKELKDYYSAKKDPVLVRVPKLNFIMIDGSGDPNNNKEFQAAVSALFTVSYTLKFMVKKGDLAVDYGVMPLEGQWWADDYRDFFSGNKAKWHWTIAIMQPDFITKEMFKEAVAKAGEKKKDLPLKNLRFEKFKEGLSAQLLHTGPFSEEGPNIQRLHDFIKEQGYKIDGKHREIYLNNFLKVKLEKMKTILRQSCA
jgi:hypothetical protein